MSAVYTVYTSPSHPTSPDLLPTLIVTPHGSPQTILYTYLHTIANKCQYLLTPSPDGDLCVAKMYPPSSYGLHATPSVSSINSARSSDSAPHPRMGKLPTISCEASRNCKFFITNAGINQPLYKVLLPNPDSPQDPDPAHGQPLFQISKTNPRATFLSMWYYRYAGHGVPPQRVLFGKIQRNASPESGGNNSAAVGGTRIAITGATREEKAVWQTLGEGNEDMVEWIILCSALAVMDEEIIKATGLENIGLARQDAEMYAEQNPRSKVQSSCSFGERDRFAPNGQSRSSSSATVPSVNGARIRAGGTASSPNLQASQRFSRDKSSPLQREREAEYEHNERQDRNIRRSQMAGGTPSAYRAIPPVQNGQNGKPTRGPADRRSEQRPVQNGTSADQSFNKPEKRNTAPAATTSRNHSTAQSSNSSGLWSKLKGGSKSHVAQSSSNANARTSKQDQRAGPQPRPRSPTQQFAAMRISTNR